MRVALALVLTIAAAGMAYGKTFVVNATDDIYAVGQHSDPAGGTVPRGFAPLPVGSTCIAISRITGSIPCASPNGCIKLNQSLAFSNDPDGNGSESSSTSVTGTANFSGLTAPHDGYLVGLFVSAQSGAIPAPPALDFRVAGGTRFRTLSPQLNQTFYVGDGVTGSAMGARQRFFVPAGAQKLYFGISDACGFHGAPSCYFDNAGTFTVSVTTTAQDCNSSPP